VSENAAEKATNSALALMKVVESAGETAKGLEELAAISEKQLELLERLVPAMEAVAHALHSSPRAPAPHQVPSPAPPRALTDDAPVTLAMLRDQLGPERLREALAPMVEAMVRDMATNVPRPGPRPVKDANNGAGTKSPQ